MTKVSAPQTKFWKNQVKKGIFRQLLEKFDKKIAFFRRAPPSILVYIGT